MNLIFTTLNKPVATSKIEKFLYDGTEEAFQKNFTNDLEKVKDKLKDLDINITIDFAKGTAKFSGNDITDEQMKIIENALHNK